jgi:hypothetical protein
MPDHGGERQLAVRPVHTNVSGGTAEEGHLGSFTQMGICACSLPWCQTRRLHWR